MALSDTACNKAKPKDKPYKMADGGGLYLEVMPFASLAQRFTTASIRSRRATTRASPSRSASAAAWRWDGSRTR